MPRLGAFALPPASLFGPGSSMRPLLPQVLLLALVLLPWRVSAAAPASEKKRKTGKDWNNLKLDDVEDEKKVDKDDNKNLTKMLKKNLKAMKKMLPKFEDYALVMPELDPKVKKLRQQEKELKKMLKSSKDRGDRGKYAADEAHTLMSKMMEDFQSLQSSVERGLRGPAPDKLKSPFDDDPEMKAEMEKLRADMKKKGVDLPSEL
mmetsp:Transcript_65867/g.129838  ORF Transcript_65867/g.129838 Transcript_65867/m.129838 type:complete len:205 (-) Transcript_65867:172-786(-)